MPIKTAELELSQDIQPIWGVKGYDGVWILVRLHGRPLGWIYVDKPAPPLVPAVQLERQILEAYGWDLVPILMGSQFGGEPAEHDRSMPVSIVVCTRDRPRQLERCVQALLALDYPEYEILIVDNAPSSEETAQLAACLPVRYVREERPGLDWARNRGIAEARHEVVAFTDDDARPDRRWLQAIARAFRDPQAMAVTGLVAPAELETDAQIQFEFHYGGMGRGTKRWPVSRSTVSDHDLFWASKFGVGANMAFRRQVFEDIGPFDVALDVGTPSGGCGDNEMFHRLVARGHTLVYEPEALIWHTHRRDDASLRQLVYNNGRSFGAYLATCARNRTMRRSSILRFAVRQWLGWWLLRRLFRPGKLPWRLVLIELAGALLSPLYYKASQRHARQIAAATARPRKGGIPS